MSAQSSYLNKKGLTVKDLVTIGIFTALFFVFELIGSLPFAPNPALTFYKEASGQFLWNEKPQDRKERLHRSYMVMQDVNFELFADSVEAECSFGIRNPDKSLIETTMDNLGLLPYRTHHPNTLSGGQKQRVAVAVSMICGKELLVFDEPTSGLDFDSMEQVALLIQKLSAMGKVIFVVTHDYEFVCRTCSRVLHIDHGEQCDDLPLVPDNEENLKKLFSI